jgi:hypothetical protein
MMTETQLSANSAVLYKHDDILITVWFAFQFTNKHKH